jgi:hypothetical protein
VDPRPFRCLGAALLAVVLATGAAPATATATRPLAIGYLDGLFASPEAPAWLVRAKDDGADIVRLPTGWQGLSPSRPTHPTDPSDPSYRWEGLDAAVKAATARGLRPLISLNGAPAWAEGPRRPKDVSPGAWKPDAKAFRPFATALARRYDGRYPDPAVPGATLPKVTTYQPWNEPNLQLYLAPQWVKRGSGYVSASPAIYRALQNAFTAGIHAAQPAALVVTAGTAPFGDPQPGGSRIMPVRCWRDALCLSRKLTRVKGCGTLAFDALAHHPYSVRGPRGKALNADDVSVPDLGRLRRLVTAAERRGTAPGRHRLWVTEVSWDSGPDDPDGVPEATQARWLADAFMVLWRQGVDTVIWYQIRDQPGPNYAATAQSGSYRYNGTPKLSARAFAFPLAVERKSSRSARIWLRSPAAGAIVLQVRRGGRWQTSRTVVGRRHAVVEATVTLHGGTAVRAVQGGSVSLAASVR